MFSEFVYQLKLFIYRAGVILYNDHRHLIILVYMTLLLTDTKKLN